jgi:hypothetical protein
MKRTLIPTAVVGAVAAIALAVPGTAQAATTTAPDELAPRLERACLRVPNLERRTTNLIERLQADATVRGSLAWLQAQIDRASSLGRDDVVAVLENRLAVRTQTLDVLALRQTELAELRQFCIDNGVTI